MSNPITGSMYLLTGLKLIFKPGIRAYVIIPLIINIVMFAALIWFGAQYFGDLLNWLMEKIPSWLQWLSWILWALFTIAGLLIIFFTFSLLANIVGAPFNGLLAEAVEKHLAGEKPQNLVGGNFFAEILPAIVNELKKLTYFIAWSIPFLILFFIPGVNLVAPFLWFVFSAWMLTLEYMDYPMANHQLLFVQQRKRIAQKRLLTLGFGGSVSVATMTPIANFLVMPAAVAGATALWLDQLKDLES